MLDVFVDVVCVESLLDDPPPPPPPAATTAMKAMSTTISNPKLIVWGAAISAKSLASGSTRAILTTVRTAIARIRDRAPDAAAHLDQAVRTGTRCSYHPPNRPA